MRRAVAVARVFGLVVSLVVSLLFAPSAQAQMPSSTGFDSLPELQAMRAAPKATPGRTKLEYRVAPGAGCDDEELFRTWTASDVGGGDPFVPQGAPLHTLRVSMTRQGPGIYGVWELYDAQDRLLLRHDILQRRCHQVIDWMSLDIAITVFLEAPSCENACVRELRDKIVELRDEARRRREENDKLHDEIAAVRAAQERERKEREEATQALHSEMEAIRVRRMDLTWALVAGPLISVNLTPNVGPGVYAGGELRAGPIGVGLELRAVLPSRVQIGPYDLDFSEHAALLVPCGRYSYFFGCAVAGGGFSLGYDSNAPGKRNSHTNSVLQLGGRLGAEVPFAENRLAVRAWGEVLYSTPSVTLDYVTPTGVTQGKWDRPDVSAFFGVGFVVKFGNEETR